MIGNRLPVIAEIKMRSLRAFPIKYKKIKKTMKSILTIITIVAVGFFSCSTPEKEKGLTFLRTSGHDFVNEHGEKVFLKGVGLGNWLLPEGYMWKFGKDGDRPRKIEKIIESMIGSEKAENFWKAFREHYITESDIQRIAELGFNSVRPALNSRLFLTEGENPVFIDEGFLLMDSLIKWCKKHRIYVIIDMHGAPGGQTGANIDDSPRDLPELFMDVKYQEQLVELWKKIAERYKDEPVVAAYNLINEPLPEVTGAAEKYKHLLIPLYKRLTSEIRKIDQKHMITLEGYDWSNNWSLFDSVFDTNVFYQFHYYCWDRPDKLKSIDYFLKKREELNTPIWVGETGEKGNTIYWGTSQYFEHHNIGFSFWPWKKMDTQNTPYSIKKPENWDLISEYTKGGAKPDSLLAEKALNQFIENIKLSNCEFFEDVANAIFNRIPGKIEAENYGHQGYNLSYFVLDTTKRSEFYRMHEPVKIIVEDSTKNRHLSDQYVVLNETEWVMYQFNNLKEKEYSLSFRLSAIDEISEVEIVLNGKTIGLQLNKKGWVLHEAGKHLLKKGTNNIQVKAKKGSVKTDWLMIL
jgi:endoglucanase